MFYVNSSNIKNLPEGAVLNIFKKGSNLLLQDHFGSWEQELKGSWIQEGREITFKRFGRKVIFRQIDTWLQDFDITDYLQGCQSSYFIQVKGDIKSLPAAGWKLHISAKNLADYISLMEILLPWMKANNILFKVVRPSTWASFTEGVQAGKFITVYLNSAHQLMNIPSEIKSILMEENNITVPGELHLGGRIYARYGAFKGKTIPDQFGNPVADIRGIAHPAWIAPLSVEDVF